MSADRSSDGGGGGPFAGPPGGRLSRRGFLKGAAAGAGAALLETGLAGDAVAQAQAGEPTVLGPGPTPIQFTLNGSATTVRVEPSTTLVEVLRTHLGLTGTKVGCDRGACAACTVWVDDEVAASCMLLAMDVRDKRVTTIEGLGTAERLHPVQQAFVEHDAMQCGFCTPGMVMSCAHLVQRKGGQTTLDDVKGATAGHLCRCGTYPNVFKATLAAAGAKDAAGTGNGKAGA